MTIIFFIFVIVAYAVYMLPSVLLYSKKRLMLNFWMPCNVNNEYCFWSLYSFQFLFGAHMAIVNVINDFLMFAFLNNICMQLNLLGLRLKQLFSKNKFQNNIKSSEDEEFIMKELSNCIQDHIDILRLVLKSTCYTKEQNNEFNSQGT